MSQKKNEQNIFFERFRLVKLSFRSWLNLHIFINAIRCVHVQGYFTWKLDGNLILITTLHAKEIVHFFVTKYSNQVFSFCRSQNEDANNTKFPKELHNVFLCVHCLEHYFFTVFLLRSTNGRDQHLW